MAPEKRGIQSFFAPVAKKPKATEAVEPVPAPVSNAVGTSPAKSPGTNASKRPADTAAPRDGFTEAQRRRAELNKQAAMSKQLQMATGGVEAAKNAGETPTLTLCSSSRRGGTSSRASSRRSMSSLEIVPQARVELRREGVHAREHLPRFNTCPMERVKVVILGQDLYHDDGQAMGLSFSVPRQGKVPSSLQNIFKELGTIGWPKPTHGDLDGWATQGVLMLNASLTVRARQANSHRKGVETFTDAAVRALAKNRPASCSYCGAKTTQEKERLIDRSKGHKVLKSPHPSGLSAHRGQHFSQANAFIEKRGRRADRLATRDAFRKPRVRKRGGVRLVSTWSF